MGKISDYIYMYNVDQYPQHFPYKLVDFGTIALQENKYMVGLTLTLLTDTNSFKTLFSITSTYTEDREKAELEVLDSFRRINYKSYLKCIEWKEC